MRILKSLIISFSMYSRIPMPQFEWKEEDMKYVLCFFPWIGLIIGVFVYFWNELCIRYGIGLLCDTVIGMVIPLLVTGGIHVDGFMDTMDAFHSYQSKDRKLEIMKDPHLGAFSVIMLALYGLIYLGAFSELRDKQLLLIFCAGFYLSRCLCGISAVTFSLAKKEGLLFLFADHAHKKIVKGTLYLQTVFCVGFMLFQSWKAGGVIVAAALCSLVYYGYRCKKEFGGITGDTAGYFVLICEGSIVVAASVFNMCS
ncbi:MAG: adenosylcobinamide-GDP ribazoletransferase [Lachnospiraceae bacterium]|nr:adenosylcobinamide-GDP ribazoletransferase [Lachnospiraceae bacterium]